MPAITPEAPPSPRHGGGGALSAAFDRVLSGLNAIGSLWILALMVLINFDAFGRTLFARPINGVIEMIELSIVGIVFLQLGDATRRGRLTRSDGFFGLMLRRRPGIGRTMGAIFDLAAAAFMALILYGSFPLLTRAIERGYYVGEEGVFTFPLWPVRLIVVIGCAVTLLQFLVFARRYVWPAADALPGATVGRD